MVVGNAENGLHCCKKTEQHLEFEFLNGLTMGDMESKSTEIARQEVFIYIVDICVPNR